MARQQHSPEEKSKLVLEAIRGERTITEIAAENNIHPNLLSKWKREAETQLYTLFQDNSSKERKAQKAREAEINDLYAQIGNFVGTMRSFYAATLINIPFSVRIWNRPS